MHTAHRLLPFALSLVALSALAGCERDDDDEMAIASVNSALQVSRQAGIVPDTVDPGDQPASAEQAAEQAVLRQAAGLLPAGCATKTRDGAHVHIVLHGCTGPFGRVRLDGSLDATFRDGEAGHVLADVVGGKDLTANDRPISYKATADITPDGDLRDVLWQATTTGTTKRGFSFTKTSSLHLKVDPARSCVTLDGVSRGQAGPVDIETTIDGLALCADACPSAGHLHSVRSGPRRERSVDVVFDGSSTAHVTTSRGSKDVPLVCADAEADE